MDWPSGVSVLLQAAKAKRKAPNSVKRIAFMHSYAALTRLTRSWHALDHGPTNFKVTMYSSVPAERLTLLCVATFQASHLRVSYSLCVARRQLNVLIKSAATDVWSYIFLKKMMRFSRAASVLL